jgi:hypothetical protein
VTGPSIQDHRADMFARRTALFADVCELVELGVRRELATTRPGDHHTRTAIFDRLRNQRLIHIVMFLANIAAELSVALAEHSEISADTVLAQIHENAAAVIDEYEATLRKAGYLP